MNIQAIIDDSLKKDTRVRTHENWHPSQFGRCYKAQILQRKGEPPSNFPDERTLRVFKCGYLFEEFVGSFLGDMQKQVPCRKDDISGYADFVDGECVYDCKSQHSKAFHYMRNKTYDFDKEKLPAILQVVCYAWILGKPKACLIHISKDDLCIDQRYFFTEKYVPKLEEELKTLRGYWDSGVVPEGEPRTYNFKEGKYCNFRTKCLNEGFDCIAYGERKAK